MIFEYRTFRNIAEQIRTKANMIPEDKFEKQKNCLYCGKELEAKYRSKKFCNDKCRIYYGRENLKTTKKAPTEKQIELNDPGFDVGNKVVFTLEKQLQDLREELSKLGNSSLGLKRKKFVESRIKELEKQAK